MGDEDQNERDTGYEVPCVTSPFSNDDQEEGELTGSKAYTKDAIIVSVHATMLGKMTRGREERS